MTTRNRTETQKKKRCDAHTNTDANANADATPTPRTRRDATPTRRDAHRRRRDAHRCATPTRTPRTATRRDPHSTTCNSPRRHHTRTQTPHTPHRAPDHPVVYSLISTTLPPHSIAALSSATTLRFFHPHALLPGPLEKSGLQALARSCLPRSLTPFSVWTRPITT